ncbi:MAG: carbohydrate ABC transporter permease [Treponema sp.]|nr:carbohydrate ABC transporter permease [Treponema sp.]
MNKLREARNGDWVVVIICIVVILLCVLPMINLLAQSLSSSDAVINGKVTFLPVISRSLDVEEEWEYDDEFDYFGDAEYSTEYIFDTDTSYSLATGDEYTYETFDFSSGFSLDFFDFSTPVPEFDFSEGYTYDYDYDYEFDDDYYGEVEYDFASWQSDRDSGRLTYNYGITMESYKYVFMDPAFTRSMWWTAILTVICTIISLVMTILCAYPLTYDWLRGKVFINTVIIFTMYFSAGTIPNYILMKSLGLLNNPLVLIIPNCLSVFNMIILRSFFFGIPDSLRESAEIDGANPFTVLMRIYLPLSIPVLATLALFYAVGRWNGFTDALLYINSAPQWHPIQLKLWQLIQNMTSIDVTTVEMVTGNVPRTSDAIKAAAIMFATVPILVVYPWLQRYFIAGVTIGAVKG